MGLYFKYQVPQFTTKTQLKNPRSHPPSFIKTYSENTDYQEEDKCPLFKLSANKNISDAVACKRADFVPGACHIMNTLFDKEPADCSHQSTHIICEVEIFNPRKPQVFCHKDVCKKFSPISIGLYLSDVGAYAWQRLKSVEEAEAFISTELLLDFRNNYANNGYCLIQCTHRTETFISQLLIIPPVLHSKYGHLGKTQSEKPKLNVNILLIDSVSRHHFYRTLPKTIKKFRDLNEHIFRTGHIFDYELVQGIKSRTFESLQALFGGDVPSLPKFDPFEIPPTSVNLNETFGKFKAHGYETLYVEDMCWQGEWGLVKEQRAMNLSAPYKERIKLFNEAVSRAGINRVDISYGSCVIMQENNSTDVFLGPKSVCYNGIYQHTYLILYMELFMKRFSGLSKPTFTFLILDTGHEDTGIRIKQLDEDLARHVSFLAHLPKTISFILSDHGNTYGHFLSASTESRVEIFHPFVFMIVPDDVSKLLGDGKMKALNINQNRLVSLIDVHFTLIGLLPAEEKTYGFFEKYNTNANGLLSPISAYRTCRDIPRRHPNLCICQASYTTQKNSSYYALFAEFALGYMNRMIVDLQNGNNNRSCLKLMATRFDNIKIDNQEEIGETIIVLDLYVKPPNSDGYTEEIFTVTLLYSVNIPEEGILFLGFNRMTPYSIYRECADSGLDLRLCICDRGIGDQAKNEHGHKAVSDAVLWARTYRSIVHKPCLHLLTRNYTAGVVLAISNTCTDIQYSIAFNFFTVNLYSSNKMPVFYNLRPNVEKLLVVGLRKAENKHWKYRYTLNFKAFVIHQKS